MTAQVNFSRHLQRQQNLRSGFIVVVLLLLLIWLASQFGQADSETTSAESQRALPIQTQQRALTPEQQQQVAAAEALVKQLNTPWLAMLTDLESVLAAVNHIYLTQLLPDSRAGQILISGEADSLTPLLNLLQQLEKQPAFNEVLLMQQRQLDDPARLGFTLKLQWQQNG